ncbi:MAG: hypothetical protein QM523_00850 [Candidatus Pacebacteria bacterium]|nr:hypothetical protein [Candidatus Paceibacterota bacterium]
MDINWKSIVATVAPSLATALGGPMSGMAVGYLAKTLLGKEAASEAEVATAVTSQDPDILLKLKAAEYEFEAKLAEVGVELEQIAAKDRGSARNREIALRDSMPKILAVLITLGFFGMLAVMTLVDLPGANRDLLNVMLGALGAAWTSVVGYFFGSSAGSQEKTRILGKVVSP